MEKDVSPRQESEGGVFVSIMLRRRSDLLDSEEEEGEQERWRVPVRVFLVACLLVVPFAVSSTATPALASDPPSNPAIHGEQSTANMLAPIWRSNIRQWSGEIAFTSNKYGIDADLIASVMQAESHGNPGVESFAGAVGLMGVMPSGPGMEWRPTSDELYDPVLNLDWGTAILSDILYQAGGDLSTALAAYNGGWEYAHTRVPRQYSEQVLDLYGRAVATRSGVSPDFASKWTIAVSLEQGVVSAEPLIVGQRPLSGLRTYGEHVLLADARPDGMALYVKAYAVPVALIEVPLSDLPMYGDSDNVAAPLKARLGEGDKAALSDTNYQLIMACLPSLTRLRGRVGTRWFAPTACPAWRR